MSKTQSVGSWRTDALTRQRLLVSLTLFLLLLGILELLPKLFNNHIDGGQLTKQTHDAAWARSYDLGLTQGMFPLRFFLEIYHEGIIPWATEFPIYTTAVAGLHHLLGIPIVIGGRLISFVFFLLMLLAGHNLGREFKKKGYAYLDLLFPLFLCWFPVFRIYAVSFMPDLSMASLGLWGVTFCWKKSWNKAALFFMLAALFKYYAVFLTLGALIFWSSQILFPLTKNSIRKWIPPVSALVLSTFPAILYVAYFIIKEIPNPITDYQRLQHHGHFSTFPLLLSTGFLSRVFTWLVIKNPSIPGSLFVLWGIWSLRKNAIPVFLISFLLGQIFFILMFAHGFFIHDYYSLPLMTIIALVAAFGANSLYENHDSQQTHSWKRPILTLSGLLLLVIFSWKMSASALFPQPFYAQIALQLEKNTLPSDGILVVADRTTELPLFASHRTGWMIPTKDFAKYKDSSLLKNLFRKKKIQWVLLFFVGEGGSSAKQNEQNIYQDLKKVANLSLTAKISEWIPSRHAKVPTVYYSLYPIENP